MQSLIKPALFWVARLGLFLSVAAWIVGQWWFVGLSHVGAGITRMFVGQEGWVLHQSHDWALPTRGTLSCEASPIKGWPQRHAFNDTALNDSTSIYGAVVMKQQSLMNLVTRKSIAIRHWLNVTTFALFYSVLKFIYRKRPEAQLCKV